MTTTVYAACGCEWAGAFCPHCGQSKMTPAHVTRCHAWQRKIPVCLRHRSDQWGFCVQCGVNLIPSPNGGLS